MDTIKICRPTIFVVFGATGDLFKKKIIPALFSLYTDGLLPKKWKIIAFARRPFSDKEFQEYVKENWKGEADNLEKFLESISYIQGTFDEKEAYTNLAKEMHKIDGNWGECSNKLLYLAVPPLHYESIFDNVYLSGLSIPCVGDKGWTRILVEKPFGNDLEHAFLLEKKLQKYFKEEQIFRIDHYLAKETMQNILSFRFSNPLFEAVWNKGNIKRVEAVIYETNDVSTRGAFYDGVGALRDVGQNHALQMIALALMSRPKNFNAKEIRKERESVLKALTKPSHIFLGQYRGFTEELNVPKDSVTETFFKISSEVKGIPIILKSGKALKEAKAEIRIFFGKGKEQLNELVFFLQPKDGVEIRVYVKKPGLAYETVPADISFMQSGEGSKDAYTKVLYDAILGDQTLFPNGEEIMAGWRFITPALKRRSKQQIYIYEKGADPEIMI